MLNDGRPMIEVIKEMQITEATWYRWLQQYGSEKNTGQTKAVKDLKKENSRLKKFVAEKELAIDILNEVARDWKILSPEPRRRAVRMAQEKFGASERFACKVLGQNRSALRKGRPLVSCEEARWHLLEQPVWDGVALNKKRVRRL